MNQKPPKRNQFNDKDSRAEALNGRAKGSARRVLAKVKTFLAKNALDLIEVKV